MAVDKVKKAFHRVHLLLLLLIATTLEAQERTAATRVV